MKLVLILSALGFGIATCVVCVSIAQPGGWEMWRVAIVAYPVSIMVGILIACAERIGV